MSKVTTPQDAHRLVLQVCLGLNTLEFSTYIGGCLYSLDWTTELDYTGLTFLPLKNGLLLSNTLLTTDSFQMGRANHFEEQSCN